MSEVNRALSQLVVKKNASLADIPAAQVQEISAQPKMTWALVAILVLVLSGGIVFWHSSALEAAPLIQAQAHEMESSTQSIIEPQSNAASQPLVKAATQVRLYSKPEPMAEPVFLARSPNHSTTVSTWESKERDLIEPQPIKKVEPEIAVKTATKTVTKTEIISPKPTVTEQHKASSVIPPMQIETVELSDVQLAQKAVSQAEKALANNQYQAAVAHYRQALNYQADDDGLRQQLAALYYGQGEVTKAAQLLEAGILRQPNQETLRLALAKLWIKEQQPQAALNAVQHNLAQPSMDYLSLRAALAQKNQDFELALNSYQQLSQREPNNSRWWLGLAIAQERNLLTTEARNSYQQALNQVGLSAQSQHFVRERLAVLTQQQPEQ